MAVDNHHPSSVSESSHFCLEKHQLLPLELCQILGGSGGQGMGSPICSLLWHVSVLASTGAAPSSGLQLPPSHWHAGTQGCVPHPRSECWSASLELAAESPPFPCSRSLPTQLFLLQPLALCLSKGEPLERASLPGWALGEGYSPRVGDLSAVTVSIWDGGYSVRWS